MPRPKVKESSLRAVASLPEEATALHDPKASCSEVTGLRSILEGAQQSLICRAAMCNTSDEWMELWRCVFNSHPLLRESALAGCVDTPTALHAIPDHRARWH